MTPNENPSPFGRLFTSLLRRPVTVLAGPASSVAASELESVLAQVDQLARRHAPIAAAPSTEPHRLAIEDQRKRWRLERDAAKERLRDEIRRLHGALATGLDEAKITRLDRMFREHFLSIVLLPPANLTGQIDAQVLHHLHQRTGELAWQRLSERMQDAGAAWPVQDGLAPGRTEQALAAATQQHLEELREAFVAMEPGRLPDLMQGEVVVWRYGYPDQASSLWAETALRAVGAALRAELFAAALEIWYWRPRDLEERFLRVLDEALERSRNVLAQGVSSLDDAAQLTSAVSRLCQGTIPALVWEYIEPRLAWMHGAGATPTIEILAEGMSQQDPVCGMALRSDRIADRVDWDGKTYFFCRTSCRLLFEQDPTRYASSDPRG